MQKSSYLTKIVFVQNLGFLAIIVLCYLDELLKLPALIFSNHPFVFRRSTLEMLLFLVVWLLVSGSTHRLLKRIRQLEEFMRVCAWCRRIDYRANGSRWKPSWNRALTKTKIRRTRETVGKQYGERYSFSFGKGCFAGSRLEGNSQSEGNPEKDR